MIERYNIKESIETLPLFFQAYVKKLSQIKHKTGNMKENTKIIAVLTEEGDLNIHRFDINHLEITMEEKDRVDEYSVLEALLSGLYNLNTIQWQEIKRINFGF